MNKSYNFIKWISFHYVFLCILFKCILDQEVFCILVHKQPHYCSLVKQELGNAEVHNCQIQGGTFLISPSLDLLQWAVFSPHSWWSLWWHWQCRWRTGTRSSGRLHSQSWDNRRREHFCFTNVYCQARVSKFENITKGTGCPKKFPLSSFLSIWAWDGCF